MTDGPTIPTPGAPTNLVDRVKGILISPKTEWQSIAAESTSVGKLFTSYAMILAAIPLIAGIVGMMLFAPSYGGVSLRPAMSFIIALAVVGYLISMGVVLIMGFIIDALSPSFGGVKDRVQATKIAVYATTPVWVVGILSIFPPLGPLIWLAYLWVIFLIYMGLGPVLKVPDDKSIVFTLVIVVAYIVLMVVLTMVLMGLVISMIGAAAMSGAMAIPN
jgi:hypothetical protein